MPRQSKTAMEEGFLKSMWGEMAEIEDEYKRLVMINILPTARKGVISVQMSATAIQADADGIIRNDKISQVYPNASSVSFTGFLWSMARRLCDQVANVEEERGRVPKS